MPDGSTAKSTGAHKSLTDTWSPRAAFLVPPQGAPVFTVTRVLAVKPVLEMRAQSSALQVGV